jgi:hypothetical protein
MNTLEILISRPVIIEATGQHDIVDVPHLLFFVPQRYIILVLYNYYRALVECTTAP